VPGAGSIKIDVGVGLVGRTVVAAAPWWNGTGGLVVTVYSPLMTGNRSELPGSYRGVEIVNPVVAQQENRQ
jgi:hypothetical protein